MNFLEDIDKILNKIDTDKINDLKYAYDTKIDIDSFFEIDTNTTQNLTPLEIAKILKKQLPKYIYGQDHVIEKIVDYFKNNLVKMRGPKATFLFLGPPATGKTYTAEIMAKVLKEYEYKVFDMTQFSREDSELTLYGTDHRYRNSSVGELTSFVLHNPKSIIVFDEIEKANNTIQNTLLSIYNTGKLIDKNGWIKKGDEYIPFKSTNDKHPSKPDIMEVDFSDTILIFTSNVGKELYNSKYFWELVKEDYSQAENMIIQALQKETKLENRNEVPAITPPFLSRLSSGGLLLFKSLKFEQLLQISKNVFDENIKLFNKYYNLDIKGINDFIYSIFLLSFAPNIDIRRLKNKVAGDFFDLVTDYIIENNLDIYIKREIKIKVSKEAKKKFLEQIKPIEDIIKYMFRKNLTLSIKKELKYENNNFIYIIKDLEFQKVQNIADIGKDGIVFEIPNVSFDDIAGHTKAKIKLKEIISFLKNPKEIKALGIDIPKGMLLYGPPGTGKTMLAKAVAHEAGLPFLATTGSDLLDLDKIDKIFDVAIEYAPSIVFIDEIDAIGSREKQNNREIFINKLLSKLDGFNTEVDIFVIAATNYPENIDPAIIRSGRIDIKVEIKSLDKEARKYFIEKMINSYQTKDNFDIEKLVLYTTGLNGSDLEKIKRECGVYIIRNGLQYLTQKILIEIINTIKYGEKIEIDLSHTLESTAIHEAGHAVISKILKPEVKIEQITITPRDKALGFVSYSNENNYKNMTKNDIKKEIQILLAGRYSQIKKYGEEGIDTGASNDLEKATKLAYLAITNFGMDEKSKNLNISQITELKSSIDIKNRIQSWIDEAEKNVKRLIDENWYKIENIANKLLEEESIDEKEFYENLNNLEK